MGPVLGGTDKNGLVSVLDGHDKEPYEMSMALGADHRPQLLQATYTSICRHKYSWNIIECDVNLPIQPTNQHLLRKFSGRNGYLENA